MQLHLLAIAKAYATVEDREVLEPIADQDVGRPYGDPTPVVVGAPEAMAVAPPAGAVPASLLLVQLADEGLCRAGRRALSEGVSWPVMTATPSSHHDLKTLRKKREDASQNTPPAPRRAA